MNVLKVIKEEDLQVLQADANASFAEESATELKAGISKELDCAHDYLWPQEVDHMQQTETWRIFSMLSGGPDSWPHALAMFQLCGTIIAAADSIFPPLRNSTVFCCEVMKPFVTDSPLFYDLDPNDYFVTTDRPFVIKMGQSDIIRQDHPDGVVVIICWKYHLDAHQGVRLDNAGLCFMQHLTRRNNLSNLKELAKQLTPQMNKFSTKIACMQCALSASPTANDCIHAVGCVDGCHVPAKIQLQ